MRCRLAVVVAVVMVETTTGGGFGGASLVALRSEQPEIASRVPASSSAPVAPIPRKARAGRAPRASRRLSPVRSILVSTAANKTRLPGEACFASIQTPMYVDDVVPAWPGGLAPRAPRP